jgi:hypothetical protein
MATFYKYAERSAESQVNWAEIGKNMTDMLRDEVALREEKKAALDEATRKYAEQLSNAPQGEHVGAKEEALRFADQASQYMLQQERLLKSGLLKPKDYMVARQNLVDGTTRGFKSMKEFQAQYSELMERARTDKSSILEIQALEEIQGYGNFRQSGFFIDAPTGKVNVGLKEEQNINGQKVMGLKDGSTRGMEYVDGAIYTRIDKFRVRESLTPIADSLGVEIQSTLDPATLSKLGTITSVEDLRNRKDIDPETNQEIFNYYKAIRDAVGTVISSPFQKASLLADTLGVQVTMDPNVAAKDPNLILKVVDPNTGRAEYQFSEQLEKKAEDYMTQQLLSMVTRKEEIKTGGQVQRQDPSAAVLDRGDKMKDAKNFGENLGTLIAGLTDEDVGNSARYTGQFAGRQVVREDGKIIVRNMDGTGESIFDLKGDPKKIASSIISAFGVENEDAALKAAYSTIGNKPSNLTTNVTAITSTPPPSAAKFVIPTDAFTQESTEAAAAFQEAFGPDFIVEDLTPSEFDTSNRVKVTAPNGKTRTFNTDVGKDAAATAKGEAEAWAKLNNVPNQPKGGASGTAAGGLNATNRKPK